MSGWWSSKAWEQRSDLEWPLPKDTTVIKVTDLTLNYFQLSNLKQFVIFSVNTALSTRKRSFTQNDLFVVRFEKNLRKYSYRNICVHTNPLKFTQNTYSGLCGLPGRNLCLAP